MNKTEFAISENVMEKIRSTFRGFPEVEKAVLFGSRAKGVAKPGSDIDLALFGDSLNFSLLGRIEAALDDLLLPYRIDLVIHARIVHQELLEHIARVGLVFYESAEESMNRAPGRNEIRAG